MTPQPLLHDSTVLVAYERELTRHAQALVMEAMVDGRIQLTTATSLAVAAGNSPARHGNWPGSSTTPTAHSASYRCR